MCNHKQQLEKQLWAIANELRWKMSADEFRDYILGFIFYKFLSEDFALTANKYLLDEGREDMEYSQMTDEDAIWLKDAIWTTKWYFLAPSELFSEIVKKGIWKVTNKQYENEEEWKSTFIIEDLIKIFKNVEESTTEESEEDFKWLFEDMDLNSSKLWNTVEQKNELIIKILVHLSKIDFQLQNTEIDILGDAYEYMIWEFASWAWKKGWEFYTPQAVSTILSKIVTVWKTKLKSVYDPTCWSGSLLLRASKEVEHIEDFYWQEMNRTTYNLARMNMILHWVSYKNFDIKQEDTLEHPQHINKKFEAIVANPPYSANWNANELKLTDERFSGYWKLAPKSKADFAFIQHMIHHLDERWTMAVVLPLWVLFRSAWEWQIRKYLIENKNYLDAIIWLPENIFYWTNIPTAILVFKKCRKEEDWIMFIDASNDYEKIKNQNLLREEDINKIIDTYTNRKEIDKYSKNVKMEEIIENEYNLNIPRYIDTSEPEIMIDINEVSKEIKEIDKEMEEINKLIEKDCKELWISLPF